MKKHNFNPGPSILPQRVFMEASQAILDYNNSRLSILEISHRSPDFVSILEESESLIRELLKLNNEYAVLFMTGGASSQFYITAMNLLPQNKKAGYVDTGTWSTKAIKEARHFGHIEVLASSEDKNYTYIPKNYKIPTDLEFLHITSNNTIYGTQFKEWPTTDVPIVCDMSSDIFTQPIDINRFSLIYAGAQKNLGPAGTTLVIVKKDTLGKVHRVIPSMVDYRNHIAKSSAFNTPPVYAIFVSLLTLRWLKDQGGVEAMQKMNVAKAALLYKELDNNPCFSGIVTTEDRSLINVTFKMAKGYEQLEETFIRSCEEANCVGVKGHRSVGGFRASMYNAMPIESVEVLVGVMQEFAQQHG